MLRLVGLSLLTACLLVAFPAQALSDWQGSNRLIQRLSTGQEKVQHRVARRARHRALPRLQRSRRRAATVAALARRSAGAFGPFLATPFAVQPRASDPIPIPSTSPLSAPTSSGGPEDLIGDPNELLESRLESLTENVPNVPQPNWSQMPVYQGTFGTGHMGGWTGYHPTIAAGGGRLYIANPDMWRVDMYDATTRAYLGKFGEVPDFESCLQTAVLCVPTGITYYHGKVYVVDDSDRIFVFNASGSFVKQLQMPVDIWGIDAAWGELWISSEWGLGDFAQSYANEHAQTIYVLDADTLVLKGVLEHPAAPWAVTASEPSFSWVDGTPIRTWDARWTDVAIAPEVGAVYAGYRSIARGALPLSTPVSDPLAQCTSGCDATALFERGADAVWGMRWLMATTGYPDGGDCVHCVTSSSWINEYSLDSAVSALPSLNRRRRWQPATANNRTSQLDTHYLNREVRIDWSGPLTKSDWINGSQNVDYIVSDADIFVVGDQAEHWYELARNFSRVDLAVDGVVKASSTSPNSSLSFDTNTLSSGTHTLTLTAYLQDGSQVVATNSQLRVDHDPPTGSLNDPGPFVSGTAHLTGSLADAHSGPRSWALQVFQGGTWQTPCTATSADVATGAYGCDWDTRAYSDGSYSIRAFLRDNVNRQVTNTAVTATRSVIVDNTAPSVSLSGLLWDAQDYRPIHQGEAPGISVTSQDSYSGARSIEILVDGVRVDYVEQGCASGCSQQRSFTLDTTPYRDGEHQVQVVARDQAGNDTTEAWAIDIEETGQAGPDPDAGSTSNLSAASGVPGLVPTTLGQLPGTLAETDDPGNLADYLPCTLTDAVSNFPVFSLGPGFEGLSTTHLIRRCAQPDPTEPVRSNFVSYIYGDCAVDTSQEEPSCVPPLEIQSWPACERNLALYSLTPEELRLPYNTTTLNGLPAAVFEEGTQIEIYTGTSTVVLFGNDPSQLLRAVNVLQQEPPSQPLGPPAAAPFRSADDLPQPDPGAMGGDLPC